MHADGTVDAWTRHIVVEAVTYSQVPKLWGSMGTNGVGDEVPMPPCEEESPYAGVGELP